MAIPVKELIPYSVADLERFILFSKGEQVMKFFGAADLHELEPLSETTYTEIAPLGSELDTLSIALCKDRGILPDLELRISLEIDYSDNLGEYILGSDLSTANNRCRRFTPLAWREPRCVFTPNDSTRLQNAHYIDNRISIFRPKGRYIWYHDTMDPEEVKEAKEKWNDSIETYLSKIIANQSQTENTGEAPRRKSKVEIREYELRTLHKLLGRLKMVDHEYFNAFERENGLHHNSIGVAIHYINDSHYGGTPIDKNPYYLHALRDPTEGLKRSIYRLHESLVETADRQFDKQSPIAHDKYAREVTDVLRAAKFVRYAAWIDPMFDIGKVPSLQRQVELLSINEHVIYELDDTLKESLRRRIEKFKNWMLSSR